MKLYAQDGDYWTTEVALDKSISEIFALFAEHGCNQIGIDYSRDSRGAKSVSLFFSLRGRTYRADFTTLEPDFDRGKNVYSDRDIAAKRKRLIDQAERQMGRIALWYMKSTLIMARYGYEEVLAPFLLQAGPDGKPTTIQEATRQGALPQGVGWLLGNTQSLPALPANTESDYTEV